MQFINGADINSKIIEIILKIAQQWQKTVPETFENSSETKRIGAISSKEKTWNLNQSSIAVIIFIQVQTILKNLSLKILGSDVNQEPLKKLHSSEMINGIFSN